MLHNLTIGAAVIGVTVLVHTVGLILTTKAFSVVAARPFAQMLAMILVVIALFAIIAVEIWIWAFVYLWLGVVGDLETAVYFSTVTFSTVGYGDVVPAHEWRLLAGIEGVSGLLLIGWSTAYLVAAGTRVGPFRSGEHF